MLRIIAGTEKHEGERKDGHNVEESFYAQHQLEALNIENEMLDEMKQAGTGKNELELRQLLGCFLFTGDDVFKKIKVLSGGEKARVALAKVIAAKGNFLMLDEPTNHLDMISVEMLIEALNKYQGTLIFVSHDRYFISKTANKIWYIEDHKIKEFVGTYDEYVVWLKEREAKLLAEKTKAQTEILIPKPQEIKNTQPQKNTNTTKENSTEIQQLRKNHQNKTKQLQRLEPELEKLKTELAAIEAQLADPNVYADKNRFIQLDESYKRLTFLVAEKNAAYEQLFEEIMELEEQLG